MANHALLELRIMLLRSRESDLPFPFQFILRSTNTTRWGTQSLKHTHTHANAPTLKQAIFAAVGAPETADEAVVAKALQDAMGNADSQFAILVGRAEAFVANFPSDPVFDGGDDDKVWVEVRLRDKASDALLVTMGIDLVKGQQKQKQQQPGSGGGGKDDDAWLISSLDWQDFRDKFYPGLSGREWLRSF
jgi:hypothetical protein